MNDDCSREQEEEEQQEMKNNCLDVSLLFWCRLRRQQSYSIIISYLFCLETSVYIHKYLYPVISTKYGYNVLSAKSKYIIR
jgi:hypothetical protein